jgi:hypothetical protein
MDTLMSRLAKLEQCQGGRRGDGHGRGDGRRLRGRPGRRGGGAAVGGRCSMAEFHRRWPREIPVIRQAWGEPDDAA